MKHKAKRIIYDIVGLFLVILSPFLGAIPGPGGFIVFFAGLSILAVHNDWAKDLLHWAKTNTSSLLDIVFVNKPKIQLLNDLIGIIAIIIGVVCLFVLASPLRYMLGVPCVAIGAFWLMRNRNRYKFFIKKR